MKWIEITQGTPNVGYFESVDVWVCCGVRTYSASFIKHKDQKEGRFYLDINFPKRIFQDITSHVTHWMYVELPN
jgi:hypothetical protein